MTKREHYKIFFFCKNSIICVVNDAEKMRIFFLLACFERIGWEQHISRSYHIQSGILLGLRYLATSPPDPVIFVLLL